MMEDTPFYTPQPLPMGFVTILTEKREIKPEVIIPEEFQSKVPPKKKPPLGFGGMNYGQQNSPR